VLSRVVPVLGPEDALWLAWPRRAAGHESDLGDNVVRTAVLQTGLVDVKVAAIGEDWSGLRFVWRRDHAKTDSTVGDGVIKGRGRARRR
jgi:hypothetical protein